MPRTLTEPHRQLARTLRSLSPTTDLLHELVGIGHFEEVAMTRDGLLIARPRGCDGFDAFLGRPTAAMKRRCAELWRELDAELKKLVLERLCAQEIPPAAVGIPVHDQACCSTHAGR